MGWVDQGVGVGLGTGWARLLRAPQAVILSHGSGSGIEVQAFPRNSGTGGFYLLPNFQISCCAAGEVSVSMKWLECKRVRGTGVLSSAVFCLVCFWMGLLAGQTGATVELVVFHRDLYTFGS